MKKINRIFSMILIAATVAGCNDREAFDNKLYINAPSKTNSILLKSTVKTAEQIFNIAVAKPAEQNITVILKIDGTLVDTYNEAYYDNAEMLPEGCCRINKHIVTISAGSVHSTDITASFKNLDGVDRDKKYVLPITIERANSDILQSARTIYYVFKNAALINVVADLEKNNAYVDWVKPEVVTGMRKLTAEALINVSNFGRMINTIMGVEGYFLIRAGDAGIPSNQLQVATWAGNFTSDALALPINQWVHIAVTYDADVKTINVYINGKNLYTTTKADAMEIDWGQKHTDEADGSRCFWIGYSYDPNRYMAGKISECRIWNKVLTEEQINEPDHFYEISPEADGLIAYWKFDDGGGQKVTDYSANKNDATISGPASWINVELPPAK
ncbi:MAG: DUF1735 and LamG domain-containing protein [Mediterranea sp.]|jgi:hypothetical protein|nr:DUF1735 and LamG domain-containing protein [Mediterranea sp.]